MLNMWAIFVGVSMGLVIHSVVVYHQDYIGVEYITMNIWVVARVLLRLWLIVRTNDVHMYDVRHM